MRSKEEYIKQYGKFELVIDDDNPSGSYKFVDVISIKGNLDITFDDGETIYSLWADFPENFTQEQIDIFMKVDRYWQNRFKSRLKD